MPARALAASAPFLRKRVDGRDCSDKNAFASDRHVELLLHVPRAMGVSRCELLLFPDGGEEVRLPFCFFTIERGVDVYRLVLPLAQHAPAEGALLFYRLCLHTGAGVYYSTTEDNCSFTLTSGEGNAYRLLAYRPGLATPKRFWGRTMYQIFVDRFCRAGKCAAPQGVLHEDWSAEIEQYARTPGEPVANNEFFGGTLWGVLEKLDYLQSLGVGALYLCPVFKAASNHKYDTGDYEEVAPEFGGEAALRALLQECHRRGMAVILDGVFNHTGDDSKYFNKYGRYPGVGAYQSAESPYRAWYDFGDYLHGYACWWDIPILPRLDLHAPEVRGYFLGESGVVARYLRMGVDGWRLDVADELPNCFLEELYRLVKQKTGGNGVVFGEVWENAADKIAYGKRRRYLLGDQLDGVMNYPLREGIIAFVRDGDAHALCRVLRELWSCYPTPVCHTLMNLLSSHDTARILTVLGGEDPLGHTASELRGMRMSEAERTVAKRLLMLAAVLQYTVYGIPCLYYGDEAGMEGYGDPFCRRTYPWGREDNSLLTFYKKLGKIRSENTVFCEGEFCVLQEQAHALAFSRKSASGHVIVAVNRGSEAFSLRLPFAATELLSGRHVAGQVSLPPDTAAIWRIEHV